MDGKPQGTTLGNLYNHKMFFPPNALVSDLPSIFRKDLSNFNPVKAKNELNSQNVPYRSHPWGSEGPPWLSLACDEPMTFLSQVTKWWGARWEFSFSNISSAWPNYHFQGTLRKSQQKSLYLMAKLMCKRDSQRRGIKCQLKLNVCCGVYFRIRKDKALEKEPSPNSKGCPDTWRKPTCEVRTAVLEDGSRGVWVSWEHHWQRALQREFVSSKYFPHRGSVCYIVRYTISPVWNKLHQQKHSYSSATVFSPGFLLI